MDDKYLKVSRNYFYTCWLAMVRRCHRPEHPAYKWYGGRGIRVCNRWLASFAAFVDDMGDRPSRDHSLDRIDNGLGYAPNNCRWATRKEQAANRRKASEKKNIIRIGGQSLRAIAQRYDINHGTLKARYRAGKRGTDLIAKDLRGVWWRGKKRNPDRTVRKSTAAWCAAESDLGQGITE